MVLAPAAEVAGEVREPFRSVLEPCGDEAFARVVAGWADPSGAGRIRVVGTARGLVEALADRPEVALPADPVVGAARVELLPLLAEQSVSVTMHRFGNPSTDAETVVHRLIAASRGADMPAQPADM